MKKAIATCMLLLFLFNLGGYYMVFSLLQEQAGRQLSERLELDQVSDKEILEVKVPLNLPYPITSTGFERVEGVVKSGDRYYQLLKQKIENDTLTLVLVKDHKSNHLEDVLYTLDEQQGSGTTDEGTLNVSIKLLQEFVATAQSITSGNAPWTRDITPVAVQVDLTSADLPGIPLPPRI